MYARTPIKLSAVFIFKKWSQKFDFLGNVSRSKSGNTIPGSLSCWSSMTPTRPLKRGAAERLFLGAWTRCLHCPPAKGRPRGCEGRIILPLEMRRPNSTGTFPFTPRPTSSFWGWFSLTRNIREKHSFFQLSLSVSFPIRNYAQAAAIHFVIMTGKNEFLMCYLYQLQAACGSSVTRHPGGMSLSGVDGQCRRHNI